MNTHRTFHPTFARYIIKYTGLFLTPDYGIYNKISKISPIQRMEVKQYVLWPDEVMLEIKVIRKSTRSIKIKKYISK